MIRYFLKILFWFFIISWWIFAFRQEVWVITSSGRNDLVNDKLTYNFPKLELLRKNNYTKNNAKENIWDNFQYNNIKNKEKSISNTQLERKKYEIIVREIVEFSLSNKHWVWDNFQYSDSTYNNLCKVFDGICWFTFFNWNFDIKEKIVYQAIVIFLVSNLDRFMNNNISLEKQLVSFRINESIWQRRWFAGHKTINIYVWWIKSFKEFFEISTHELWHIIDLWIIDWNSSKLHDSFTEFWYRTFPINDPSLRFYSLNRTSEKVRKSTASFKNFVSWYALTDTFEDFAESFNMYLNHYDTFETMSKYDYVLSQKFAYLKNILWNNYFFKDEESTKRFLENQNRRPYDTTKVK